MLLRTQHLLYGEYSSSLYLQSGLSAGWWQYVKPSNIQPAKGRRTPRERGGRWGCGGGFKGLATLNKRFKIHSIAIPVVVYGFMGVEVIAVTAFEARNPKALRFPAKWIAYICFFLEFFLVLGEVLTVHWKDPALHQLDQRDGTADQSQDGYVAIFVLAPLNARIQTLPGFLSGCVIFCVLSCANTALYVASRTLFGLTREIPSNHDFWLMRWLSRLGTTTPRTFVPGWALVVSVLVFCWLPFLHFKHGYSTQYVSTVCLTTAP